MPMNCAVTGCLNPGTVGFPCDPGLLLAWRVALNREGIKRGSLWTPSTHSKLCHDHFKPEDYRVSETTVPGSTKKFIKASAVPSLKLGTTKSVNADAPETPRATRKRRRDQQETPTLEEDGEETFIDFFETEPEMCLSPLHADMQWIGREEEIQMEPSSVESLENGAQELLEEEEKDESDPKLELDSNANFHYSIERFENNPEALQFYTGFRDYAHFNFFFSCLEPAIYRLDYRSQKLSRKNEFFLTIMKLRCAKPDIELSIMFGIGKKVVALVFNTMVRFLFYHLKDMTTWLPKNIVDCYTPLDFKAKYPGTRVLLDATEFFVEKPKNVQDQSATWSSYKNHSTLKSMIGISPRGVVSYVSPTYGGCTSDRQIIERSELVKKDMFEEGDSIMADRGIMVQDLYASMNVKVNTPTMLKGRSQLSSTEVIRDRRIAAKRIHIERVIGLAKTYKILAGQMHHCLRPLSDKIIFVCFALCNFKPCIVGNYA